MVDGKVNKDLRMTIKWTTGERIWLWRTELGLTQRAAAKQLRLSPKQYWKFESDITDYGCRPTIIARPGPSALCRLARRRHGLDLRDTARRLGISHTTLLQREAAGDPTLVKAWQSLGYRF